MMSRRVSTESEVISASTAGRVGGAALLFGAFAYYLTILTNPSESSDRTISFLLSLVVVVMGAAALWIPWGRLGSRSTLILIPPIFAILAVGNYHDPMPRIDAVFFVLIGVWIGLCHPRFTTLMFTPVFAAVYWAPIALRGETNELRSATLIVTVVSVGIGELLGVLRTTLERSQSDLALSTQRRFAALTRNSIDVTFVFNTDETIRYVSPSASERLGYEPAELEALPLAVLLTDYVEGIFDEDVAAILDGSYGGEAVSKNHELRFLHANGEWIDIEATAQNLIDDPDIGGIVVHLRDIRSRKALENDLHYRAFHDALTGLSNRAAFHDAVRTAKHAQQDVSVIFIDLDGFKSINDSRGHQQGDTLLRLAAKRLSDTAPPGSVVARIGGDEFAVLAKGSSGDAAELARRLVGAIRQPFTLEASVVMIGASAGVASVRLESSDGQAIGDADMAMYQAKADDSRDVAVFEPQMRQQLVKRLDDESRLRSAVSNGEFLLHYQPAVDLRSGMWLGAEALLRWNDPDRGLVLPGEFIGLAEDSGLIVEMGRQVIFEACRALATWPTLNGVRPNVGVNVSPRQLRDPEFLNTVEAALNDSGLSADRLIVEVTESILISDITMAEEKLRHLADMGAYLALDDFGTGYASLSYLRSLPFHLLKIDRSFVSGAPTRPRDLSLLQTINRLGHDLGLRTLVEGVETKAHATLVSSLNCDMAQGLVFARPMSSTDLIAAMEQQRSLPREQGLAIDRS